MDLSLNLRHWSPQRLLPKRDGRAAPLPVEIMLNTR